MRILFTEGAGHKVSPGIGERDSERSRDRAQLKVSSNFSMELSTLYIGLFSVTYFFYFML